MKSLKFILVALILTACSGGEKKTESLASDGRPMAPEVLSKIESYTAPPYPDDGVGKETWDFRVESGEANPPTKTDGLICDVWQRLRMDVDIPGLDAAAVTSEQIEKALNVYLEKDWGKIAGYRPWTHWNFIRSLAAEERKTLSGEIAEYIKKNGVKDPAK